MMKKYTMLVSCSLLLSAGVFAQHQGSEDRDPEQGARKMADRLGERLSLEPEKKDSLTIIFEEFMTEARESRQAHRESLQAMAQERDEKIKQLLSEAQYQDYEKMLAARKDRRKDRGSKRH